MNRTCAVLAVAAAGALMIAGCSSAGAGSWVHRSLAVSQTGAGGLSALAAQPPGGSARDVVRLGFVASPADGIALVGVQDSMYREDLGAGAELDAISFPTSATARTALDAGRLDAAYLDPVDAVAAWQATGGKIRVIAGAALAGGRSSVVLAVAASFLVEHPVWVQGLLKGQIQAMRLLTADPVPARRLAAGGLTALGHRVSAARFARASAGITFTCDPLTGSVLAQARQAAKTGVLAGVGSLQAMYDLVPVDELLMSAGLRPVSSAAS
jgi:ABC-type nitrate/sulfonate/bicarbonate transport system substrate-binding protein